jgi:hypothetical protein
LRFRTITRDGSYRGSASLRRSGALLAIAGLAAGCGASARASTATTTTSRQAAANAPASTTTKPQPTPSTAKRSARPAVDLCPFRGLGTWVDVYDYVPEFAEKGRVAPVKPDAAAAMRAAGVHTLFLQVAKDDPRSPQTVTNTARAAEFLVRAHAAGLRVVAWYLPTHRDPALDLERALALVHFRAAGQRFDGVALDIEGVDAVPNVAERNNRLVALVDALDRAAGPMPIGAIVYPTVALDVLNPTLWPSFPYRALAPHIDVWLPMAYWTFRHSDSPYRDAWRYITENVVRLRAHLGNPTAPVHVIGGIADTSSPVDDTGMVRAAREQRAIGWSLYDFNTTVPSAWPLLRAPAGC